MHDINIRSPLATICPPEWISHNAVAFSKKYLKCCSKDYDFSTFPLKLFTEKLYKSQLYFFFFSFSVFQRSWHPIKFKGWQQSYFGRGLLKEQFCHSKQNSSAKCSKFYRDWFLHVPFKTRPWEPDMKSKYRKNLKTSDNRKRCCNYPKNWTMWFYHRVMGPKHADGMANKRNEICIHTVCQDLPVQKLSNNTVNLFHSYSKEWLEFQKPSVYFFPCFGITISQPMRL